MNRTDLINAVSAKTGQTKKAADESISAVLDAIMGELAGGGKVQLVGFGTFEVRNRAARTGRNPQTKQEIKVAASKAPVFKAGKAFKDAVSK